MKRLLLTIITFSIFSSSLFAQELAENDTTVAVVPTQVKKQDNFFKKVFPPKQDRRPSLLRQRDSLFTANDSLMRIIDTLRMEIDDYELITSSDTL